MAELILHVAIIFLMIAGCIGSKDAYVPWSKSLDHQLLNIYYETYPPDERHFERIKEMWDKKVPLLNHADRKKLKRHINDLKLHYLKQWQSRSGTEREQMEDTFTNIYKATNDGRPQHEKRILKEFFKIHPDSYREYDLFRIVLYRWYERLTPLGKEINAKDVDWTPQRKADIMHIDEQIRKGNGHIYIKMKKRWLKMHEYLNINEKSLADYVYKLKRKDRYEPSMREKLKAELKYRSLFPPEVDELHDEEFSNKWKKVRWTDKMNADLLHINDNVRFSEGKIAAKIKDRWDRMQGNLTHFNGAVLLARADLLHKTGYMPKPENIQNAKEKYEALPPIPPEIISKQTGKRRAQQLEIRKGKSLSLQHQDDPFSPGFELTPEQMSFFQQDMEDINGTYSGHAYYPHHNFYYGSSSHTPIDQGPFGSLPDTPHPQHHQRYPGKSSSHTPTDYASSSTQPHLPKPYEYQWHPGSSSNHSQHPPQ